MANIEAEKAYETIVDRCRVLRDGKFIRSTENINRLLQSIVTDSEAFAYVKKCNEMYGYGNELNSAVQDKNFVLPINKHKVIVLVTGLLRQFLLFETKGGSGKENGLDFYHFLKRFYPSIDTDKSFALFVDAVIFPYARAFKGMVEDECDMDMAIDDGSEWVETLNNNVKEQIYPCISRLSELITADNHILEAKKKEYLIMIEGFNHALEVGNTKMINVVYIGLRNTIQGYRDAGPYIRAIERLLTSYRTI